jgi:hypothetical protein
MTKTLAIGPTTYLVEQAGTDADTYFLTGPRGGTLIAVPFINDPDTYHAFRAHGTHADLKINGQLAKISRTELEAA